MLLMKRIRLIAERNAASPAERLLDDLLRLQEAADNAIDANEVQEVPFSCSYACSRRQSSGMMVGLGHLHTQVCWQRPGQLAEPAEGTGEWHLL